MAVTIDTNISEYYTWGSYPYDTWDGDEYKSWRTSGVCRVDLTDTETIPCAESYVNVSSKLYNEKVQAQDTFSKNVYANKLERINLLDITKKLVFNAFFDDFGITESKYNNYIGISKREKFQASDMFSRRTNTKRTYAETVKLLDVAKKSLSVPLFDEFSIKQTGYGNSVYVNKNENVSISDKANKQFISVMLDSIGVSDILSHQAEFYRTIKERVSMISPPTWGNYKYETWGGNADATWDISYDNELCFKSYEKHDTENFGIVDTEKNAPHKICIAPIQVTEQYSRKTRTKRTYTDNVGVADLGIKKYQKLAYDECVITDRYLKPFEGTYSNIFITEGEFSDDDFAKAINTVQGYTDFIDFKVGEYEYQEALVRVLLTSNSQAQPTAAGVTLHVDIPDTDDRGSVVITKTDSATEIPFNKSYYVVPEVQVTLRGASTSSGVITPNITNVTTKYFEVELLTAGGERTTGTISWASKGY